MNIFKNFLMELRRKSVEEAIARCDAYTVYSDPNLFPPFFFQINDAATVREVKRYGMQKVLEAIKKQYEFEKAQQLLEQEKLMTEKQEN